MHSRKPRIESMKWRRLKSNALRMASRLSSKTAAKLSCSWRQVVPECQPFLASRQRRCRPQRCPVAKQRGRHRESVLFAWGYRLSRMYEAGELVVKVTQMDTTQQVECFGWSVFIDVVRTFRSACRAGVKACTTPNPNALVGSRPPFNKNCPVPNRTAGFTYSR